MSLFTKVSQGIRRPQLRLIDWVAIMVALGGVLVHLLGVILVRASRPEVPASQDNQAYLRWARNFSTLDTQLLDPEPLYLPSAMNAAAAYRPAAVVTSAAPLFEDFPPVINLAIENLAMQPLDDNFNWSLGASLGTNLWPTYSSLGVPLQQPVPVPIIGSGQRISIELSALTEDLPLRQYERAANLPPKPFYQLWKPVRLRLTVSAEGNLLPVIILEGSGFAELDAYLIDQLLLLEDIASLPPGNYDAVLTP